jgi:hypothetical protein
MKRRLSEKEQAFWARYAEALYQRKIVGKNAEWHIVRAQEYVEGLNGKRIRTVSAEEMDQTLNRIGRMEGLSAWQQGQIASALAVLFQDLIKSSWVESYDWTGRIEGFRKRGHSAEFMGR